MQDLSRSPASDKVGCYSEGQGSDVTFTVISTSGHRLSTDWTAGGHGQDVKNCLQGYESEEHVIILYNRWL